MSVLDLQGMAKGRDWDENSNLSVGCEGESGLSLNCSDDS